MFTALKTISLISGIAGFLLLNLVCFHRFWESILPLIFRFSSVRRRVVIGSLSIIIPILVSYAVIGIGMDIGISFTAFYRGTIVGYGVFPTIAFIAILVIWAVMAVGAYGLRKLFKSQDELVKLSGWRGPIFGALIAGWIIPLVIIVGKLYFFDRHHIDWTEAQRHSPGINLYFFLDAISTQCACIIAFIHACVYIGGFIVMCFPKVAVQDKPDQYVRRFSFANFSAIAIPTGIILVLLYSSLDRFSWTPYSMREIMHGVLNFQSDNESIPLYSKNADGTPLHSWRVLILPYLHVEEKKRKFYENIRLDEPWDSEHNRQFHFAVPEVFQSREKNRKRNPEEKRSLCDFSVVVGPDAFFQEETALSLEDVKNQPETILLIERETPVHWMDPNHELKEENLRGYICTV